MPEYITKDDVRRTTGLDSDEISDTDMEGIIEEVESELPRILNTALSPKERIDFLDGNGTNRIFVKKLPLIAVRQIKIGGDSVTIDGNVKFYSSGRIYLDDVNGSPDVSYFKKEKQVNVIRYLYGDMEKSDTSTTTDAESSTGTSVTVSVNDESGFSDDDWVEIYGMDGNREVAQITGTDTGEITVDELRKTHESGSYVYKLQTKEIYKKLLNVLASIMASLRMIGTTYTFNTGYSISEFNVQKGVPYTHWREVLEKLIKVRDDLLSRIKPKPSIFSSG